MGGSKTKKEQAKVAPLPVPIETVKLLGGGLKGPSSPPRIFPGDLIAYSAEKPFEWKPWFGVVVPPQNSMARYLERLEHPNNSVRTLGGKSTLLKGPRKSVSPTIATDASSVIPVDAQSIKEEIPEDGIPDPVCVNWAHSRRLGVLNDRKMVAVVDRSLVKGQRVKNADGVCGTVVDRSEKVTIQVLNTEHVIDNVDVIRLSPVTNFFRGREILFDGWIGIITAVRRLLTCRLDTGGACFYLKTNETDGFLKPDPYWGLGMPCAGLPTKFAPATMKKAVFAGPFMRFIHRWVPPVSYFYTRSAAQTLGVDTISIDVMWVHRCPNILDAPLHQPPMTLQKEDLFKVKGLGLPNYETLGLNSVRMYGIRDEDAILSHGNWYAGFQSKFFGAPEMAYTNLAPAPSTLTSILSDGYQVPVKVIFRSTEVEVEWDNGLCEHLLASKLPTVLCRPQTTDFETGVVVELKQSKDGESKYGVIQCREETDPDVVRMRWIYLSQKDEEDDVGSVRVSVNDLKVHPMVSTYSRGTTVFLEGHPEDYKVGTIMGLDLKKGKVLVVVPDVVEPISVYPHMLIPLPHRNVWDFWKREWVQIPVKLPAGMVEKPVLTESEVAENRGEEDLIQLHEEGSNETVSEKPGVVVAEKVQEVETTLEKDASAENVVHVNIHKQPEIPVTTEKVEHVSLQKQIEVPVVTETVEPAEISVAAETVEPAEIPVAAETVSSTTEKSEIGVLDDQNKPEIIAEKSEIEVTAEKSEEIIESDTEKFEDEGVPVKTKSEIILQKPEIEVSTEKGPEIMYEKFKPEIIPNFSETGVVVELEEVRPEIENNKLESFPKQVELEIPISAKQVEDIAVTDVGKLETDLDSIKNEVTVDSADEESAVIVGNDETEVNASKSKELEAILSILNTIDEEKEKALALEASEKTETEEHFSKGVEAEVLLASDTEADRSENMAKAEATPESLLEITDITFVTEASSVGSSGAQHKFKDDPELLATDKNGSDTKPEKEIFSENELKKLDLTDILAEDTDDTPRSLALSDFNLLGDFESDSGTDVTFEEPRSELGATSVSTILPAQGQGAPNEEEPEVKEGQTIQVDST